MPPGESARSRTTTESTSAERGGDRRCREGPERDELEQPDRLAGVAQLVDDVLHRSRRRAECDDRGRRAVEPVLLDLAVAASAEQRELGSELDEDGGGRLDRGRLLAAELVVVVGHRERPLRRRPSDVEHGVGDAVLADEAPDGGVREQRRPARPSA